MPTVWIPAPMRDLAEGAETIVVAGSNMRQVIAALEEQYPGMKARLCNGDQLRSGIAVAVDAHITSLGLMQPVGEYSEVHFLPAISGGK